MCFRWGCGWQRILSWSYCWFKSLNKRKASSKKQQNQWVFNLFWRSRWRKQWISKVYCGFLNQGSGVWEQLSQIRLKIIPLEPIMRLMANFGSFSGLLLSPKPPGSPALPKIFLGGRIEILNPDQLWNSVLFWRIF